MRLLLSFFTVLIVLAGLAAIMKTQRPDMFYGLMIGFKSGQSTLETAAERTRLDYISLLPISNEKKQFLVQHTIFMGASQDMVRLALGKPRRIVDGRDAHGGEYQRWGYMFEGDSRPTVLQFEDNKLISAYHTSYYSDPALPAPVAVSEGDSVNEAAATPRN